MRRGSSVSGGCRDVACTERLIRLPFVNCLVEGTAGYFLCLDGCARSGSDR